MNGLYLAMAGAALLVLLARREAQKRAAQHPVQPLLRIYESRLLAACRGDYVAVERLIKQELKRRPGIDRLDAARRAHDRLRQKRAAQWTRAPQARAAGADPGREDS
jgi:ATP-dependent protease Clp ATPase subunit